MKSMWTRIAAAAAVATAFGLGACDSPTDGREGGGTPVVAGTVVTGTLAPGDSARWYTVQLPTAEVRLLLQARSGSSADSLVAELVNASGGVVARVTSVGTDATLGGQASEWVAPTPGAVWRIRVRRGGADDGGPFSLTLFPRNAAPEKVAAAITPGQTVEGEAVDVGGDVDEFRLAGQAGQEWILFAQATAPWSDLKFALVDSASAQEIALVETYEPTTALEETPTLRVVLPRTGTYLVRVTSGFGNQNGPYRFRVDAISRAPESGTAARALGAVIDEAIGSVADVDEYTFAGHAGQELNLLVQPLSAMPLTVELLRGTEGIAKVETAAPSPSLDDVGTGRLALPAEGTYTVRVSGPAYGVPAGVTGGYRLELYPVDRRAEAGGQPGLDGPAVAGALDRPGDVDEFALAGTAGQLAVVHLTTPRSLRGPLRAELVRPDGSVVTAAEAGALGGGAGDQYSLRAPLPVSGTYTLRVLNNQYRPLATGPYSIEAYTVSAAPEHVPATVAIGQTVSGERIDRPGDLDVFTVNGPSPEVNFFLGRPGQDGDLVAALGKVGQPGYVSPIFTFAGPMSLDGASTGRLTLEPGAYTLAVDPNALGQGQATTGAYAFRFFPIDRAPEGRSAAYTLGETVSGEALYPAGDIDTYTFTLTQPRRVHIVWDAPYTGPHDAITALLSNGGPQFVWNNFETNEAELVRDLTLPAGTYTLTLSNMNVRAFVDPSMPRIPTISYRFAFIPQ